MQIPVEVQFKKLCETAIIPTHGSNGAAGWDLYASKSMVLFPQSRTMVPTGLAIALPEGYEMQIRSRSGLAAKSGVFVLNSPGTVDEDYRGELGVILHNTTDKEILINQGDRVAQAVLAKYERQNWVEINELPESVRGTGGFGSTGK